MFQNHVVKLLETTILSTALDDASKTIVNYGLINLPSEITIKLQNNIYLL